MLVRDSALAHAHNSDPACHEMGRPHFQPMFPPASFDCHHGHVCSKKENRGFLRLRAQIQDLNAICVKIFISQSSSSLFKARRSFPAAHSLNLFFDVSIPFSGMAGATLKMQLLHPCTGPSRHMAFCTCPCVVQMRSCNQQGRQEASAQSYRWRNMHPRDTAQSQQLATRRMRCPARLLLHLSVAARLRIKVPVPSDPTGFPQRFVVGVWYDATTGTGATVSHEICCKIGLADRPDKEEAHHYFILTNQLN